MPVYVGHFGALKKDVLPNITNKVYRLQQELNPGYLGDTILRHGPLSGYYGSH